MHYLTIEHLYNMIVLDMLYTCTYFLFMDRPNSVEDDDQRKRRRKKERSSLFFRKKKDKTASKTSVSGPSAMMPSGIIGAGGMMGFGGAGVGSGSIGDVNARNLAKAPSAVSIANKPSQGR